MRFVQNVILLAGLFAAAGTNSSFAADGNRLLYLTESDPYYVSRDFPRLATPQWVGESGVEAVVILAIDDMRGHERWEAYLRPILERLKQIDGRAPLSIMTCDVAPDHPHLQQWLREGLSLEVHTVDHPCPLLQGGDFAKARSTYDRCVDLLFSVPGNQPVAFRMPCCDSRNTVSPRFYAEIFNRRSPAGNFLQADSSVFTVLTSNDPELPRELVLDSDGRERFRKYLPFPSFVNTIEDYPYPYTIGRLCWEFPCIVPSDWEAQNLQKPNNPATVRDLKAALDAVVIKQGVLDLVFHPHGWIRADQVNELIDYATAKHGGKVKFLTFREAVERLTENALAGHPLRADDGRDNGVRLIDLNADRFLDVVIGNEDSQETRIWSPTEQSWQGGEFPAPLVTRDAQGQRRPTGVQFGVLGEAERPTMIIRNETFSGAWMFDVDRWREAPELLAGLVVDGGAIRTNVDGQDRGVRFIDLDQDGRCELLVANPDIQTTFRWDETARRWQRLPFRVPEGALIVDAAGNDRGLRFVDLDDDLKLDLVFSNEERYGVYLFDSLETGWSRRAGAGSRNDEAQIPMITRGATNNGAWFHSRHLWLQNEDTDRLNDLVDRRSFNELFGETPPLAKSPEASLAALKARDGFVVELVAAEPLINDPVNFDWGPDGKLWVVEMGDYPRGADDEGKPGGRVRVLKDVDDDGRYDQSTLFLEGLSYPTSATPWRQGALVMCAPEIFYAEDTDGDGRADRREILYSGLSRVNPQHRANGFVRGLDNWIYCAGADNVGTIASRKIDAQIKTRGSDFRIRPDTGEIETVLGSSQFIRARDDWGNWFGNNNINPMFHFALEDRYLGRNPHVAATGAIEDVPINAGTALVYPRSRTIERFNDLHTANRFTSACSSIVYRDDLFGPHFTDNVFVSEPVHNLVHREIMTPRGVTFSSQRPVDEQHSEFLASTDNWFRPTRIRTGPDGALWVADMYRFVIEHTEWIPPEAQSRIDVRAGEDHGRIYRVYPVGQSPRPIPRLGQLDPKALVAKLESPSGWVRDKAQELIVESGDASSATSLETLVQSSPHATARLHALYTLAGLESLTPGLVLSALDDEHPGVRRHALRLSEPFLGTEPEITARLLELIDDTDPQVRLQLAYTLGEWNDSAAGRALGKLALAVADDRYLSSAILSSSTTRIEDMVAVVTAGIRDADLSDDAKARLIANLLNTAIATDDIDVAADLVGTIGARMNGEIASWQLDALALWLERLEAGGETLSSIAEKGSASIAAAIQGLDALFVQARDAAASDDASQSERLRAVGLLGRGTSDPQEDMQSIIDLLGPRHPESLQQAAAESLARLGGEGVAQTLLAGWKSYTPGVRSRILSLLIEREASIAQLLGAVESGLVMPNEIDASRRQRLLSHKSEEISGRAKTLFAGSEPGDRRKVIEQYRVAAERQGDATSGQEVFKKRCSVCHRLGETGHAIGPDLAALTDKSAEAILLAVLDPNRAIEARYVSYTAVTDSGLTYQGLLAEETGSSVTLLEQEGKKHVIPRSSIDELASSGKSLMPEGLEKDVTPQEMADCLAFLRDSEPVPKQIEGNRPELVRADALRGEIFCLPSNAEIFGQTLRIEEVNGTLGWWNSEDDHVVWNVDVPRASRYTVILEWSCDDSCEGNDYLVEIAGQRITGTVEGTGDWNDFRRAVVGTVELEPGQYRLGIRSNGAIQEALFDLKTVILAPRGAYD